MSRWRSDRGWCACPTSGPVAVGFWRLVARLAVPVVVAPHRPARQPALAETGTGHHRRDRRDLLRARSRRVERRHPHDQARQCDPVRQYRQLRLRRLRPVAGPPRAVRSRRPSRCCSPSAGAALLMSGSYELSPKQLRRRSADPRRRPALRRLSDFRRARAGRSSSRCRCCSSRPCSRSRAAGRSASALASSIWPHDWTPLIIFALSSQVIGQGLLVYSIGTLPPLVVGLALLTQPAMSAADRLVRLSRDLVSLTDVVGARRDRGGAGAGALARAGVARAADEPS